MRVPLSWLKEYVPVTMPVADLAHRLTMAGIEVGAVEQVGGSWQHCFVGRVLSVDPHPNADRLSLCTVDIGAEQKRVVCGAPNVAAEQRIAFAEVGATLHDTHSGRVETLKAARIRGEVSEGMICSEIELGIGDDHTGILVLPPDAPIGTPLGEYLGDAVLELEVTANRVDCFSMLGVAYEVGAFSGASVQMPDLSYPEAGAPMEDQAAIEVWDAELSPRYTASLVTGVRVAPSPQWMQDRIIKGGLRPINNIVDITNYVMLEYGQPLHAFDFEKVKGRKIIVRPAAAGETIRSLDGVERKLAPPMLVIADERDPIGLAGVIGGANSEVADDTTAVLVESASFHALNTRRTAVALGARTEASLRFEKGLRPELPPPALRRATQLILQLAGGTAARGIVDVYPGRRESTPLRLTSARLEKVLGLKVPQSEVVRALASLGFQPSAAAEDAVDVAVPPWRADISMEDDLVEEVARVMGYDELPTVMLAAPIPYHQPDPPLELRERVRDLLAAAGFQETVSYPLVSDDLLRRGGNPVEDVGRSHLRLSNPMSLEHVWLRQDLRASLLSTLAANWRHEEGPIRLFEVGRGYIPRSGQEGDGQLHPGRSAVDERQFAAGVLMGPAAPPSWHQGGESLAFFDAKGAVEGLLQRLHVRGTFDAADDPLFLPGRAARILGGGRAVGIMGEVHPSVLERFDVSEGPVAYFELDLAALLQTAPQGPVRFRPLPRFPGALRDLALQVAVDVPAARVQETIEKHRLVAEATLFDVYAGSQVAAGVRSLAFRVLFRAPDRTLTAEEVGRALEQLLANLDRELGAVQRQG